MFLLPKLFYASQELILVCSQVRVFSIILIDLFFSFTYSPWSCKNIKSFDEMLNKITPWHNLVYINVHLQLNEPSFNNGPFLEEEDSFEKLLIARGIILLILLNIRRQLLFLNLSL